MHLTKHQAETIVFESKNLDSKLMQAILKMMLIKNIMSQAQANKSRHLKDLKRFSPLAKDWYIKRIDLMDRITDRLTNSYQLQMERVSLLSRTEKRK